MIRGYIKDGRARDIKRVGERYINREKKNSHIELKRVSGIEIEKYRERETVR